MPGLELVGVWGGGGGAVRLRNCTLVLGDFFFFNPFIYFFKFIYFEREHEQGRGKGRGRKNPSQVPHYHDLSRNQESEA